MSLQTTESIPLMEQQKVVDISLAVPNLANELIEHFMIASNAAIANLLAESELASLRRVVRTPKRWDRIVQLAAGKRGKTASSNPIPKL